MFLWRFSFSPRAPPDQHRQREQYLKELIAKAVIKAQADQGVPSREGAQGLDKVFIITIIAVNGKTRVSPREERHLRGQHGLHNWVSPHREHRRRQDGMPIGVCPATFYYVQIVPGNFAVCPDLEHRQRSSSHLECQSKPEPRQARG